MWNKTFTFFLVLGITYTSFAQIGDYTFNLGGRGAYTTFASDYQALDINAANLGFGIDNGTKRFAVSSGEIGLSASSKLFNNEVITNVKTVPFSFDVDKKYSYSQFEELSSDLQDGFVLNANTRIFGGAIHVKKVGTFALSIQGTYQMNFGLSKDFADITTFGFGAPYFDSLLIETNGNTYSKVMNTPSTFDSLRNDTNTRILAGTSSNPKSISSLIKGTNMNISWLREYNIGYGTKLLETEDGLGIYVGGSVKYIQGIATFNLSVDDNNQLQTFGAYSNSFDSQNGFLTSGGYQLSFPKAAGQGYGIGLGANISYKQKVTIGASVNNIGSVTWNKNTFTALGDPLLTNFQVGGFYADSSATNQGGGTATFDSVLNALIKIEKTNESRTVVLPATARLGFGLQFKFFSIGVDAVTPFNKEVPGSLEKAIFSFGGTVNLGPIRLSSGAIFGGNYVNRIPFGIVFAPAKGRYEMGISTQDITAIFTYKTDEKPIFSGALGFARVKF